MCCSSRIRKATVLLPSGVRKIIKLVQLNLEACGTTQLPWRLLQSPHASKHKGMFRCNPRIQSVTAGALHQLQLVQIELQGQYSRTRLCSFHAYLINTFTFKRLVAVLFVTPWPSIATIVLMEVIPLNPPSAGVQGNIVFWGRFAGFTVIESICYIAMTHLGVRLLDLTPLQRLISAICGSAAAIGAGYICAIDIGFPVPFMVTTTAVPCLLALWTSMGVFSIRRILTDPAAVASLKEWVYVCVIVATQLFIYPLYYHIFGLASPLGQSALSIVLGVVKIGYRFAIGSVVKQQADYRPEIVTITTEIYHAMFVSFSMQNAASLMTVAVLLIVDLLHSSSVIYEVNIMCHRLEALDRTIRPPTSRAGSSVDRAMALVSRYHSSDGPVATTIESLGFRNSRKNRTNRCNCGCLRRKSLLMMKNTTKISVVPTLQPIRPISIHGASSNQHYPKLAKPKIAKDIGAAEAEYIAITLRILHLTEFTMLGELVEFVVPTIFSTYLRAPQSKFDINDPIFVCYSFLYDSNGEPAESRILPSTRGYRCWQHWRSGAANVDLQPFRAPFARCDRLDSAHATWLLADSAACDGARNALGVAARRICHVGRVHGPRPFRALRSVVDRCQ